MRGDVKNNDRSFLVIHDAAQHQWLRFEHPRLVVVATTVAQVVAGLQQVEAAVREHGWYAVGFVGYQAAAAFDPHLVTVAGGALPLMWFGLYDNVATIELPTIGAANQPLSWRTGVAKKNYLNAIARVKQYIARGDTYQVNYTYPLQCGFVADPWLLFIQLQQAQQGDYGAYIDTGRHVICSASPELFFSRCGNEVTTRPMKGTAPRGRDAIEDVALRDALSRSSKDRAENLMIVDMLRNDLGRIARTGTISVDKLFAIERYPTLWQMTTEVKAQSDCSIVELFLALFPCASITGAPKVRSMEIIAEIEQSPRQIYTGSIGFIAPDGRAQFNVAIRTALIDRQQRRGEYRVGGGIVWDSDPEQEYVETQTKAKVLDYADKKLKLLETLLWEPESGYRLLTEHLQRLMLSAGYFGYSVDVNLLRQGLINAAAARTPQRWRVRCLVDGRGQHQLQFVPQPYRRETSPLRLALAHRPVDSSDPLLYHKTDQRQRYESLFNEVALADGDIDDVVMFNERGEVTETTIANIVIYNDGRWLTPPLHCGLLPGTMRQMLLANGTIIEQVIRVEDLQLGTPLYVINSVRGWRWAQLQPTSVKDYSSQMSKLIVEISEIKLSPLEFLQRHISAASRSYLRQLLKKGKVQTESGPLTEQSVLSAGLELQLPDSGRMRELLNGCKTPLDSGPVAILYESREILIVDKAPGIAIHASVGHEDSNLTTQIEAMFKQRGVAHNCAPIHRLDLDTSGPVLFGKGRKACSELGKMFMQHDVEKCYLALTKGRLPGSGMLCSSVTAKGKEKESHTAFRAIDRNDDASLIELTLHSGRQHQIRRQLADIDHPLFGDRRYGGPCPKVLPRMFLHCCRLAFVDPFSGAMLEIDSPLPDDLKPFLAECSISLPDNS